VAHSGFLADLMRQVNALATRWIVDPDRTEVIKRGRVSIGVTITGAIRVGREPQDAPGEVLNITVDVGKIFAAVDSNHHARP
jgi:hypothetical protein